MLSGDQLTVVAGINENGSIYCTECMENEYTKPLTQYDAEDGNETGMYCDTCSKEIVEPYREEKPCGCIIDYNDEIVDNEECQVRAKSCSDIDYHDIGDNWEAIEDDNDLDTAVDNLFTSEGK